MFASLCFNSLPMQSPSFKVSTHAVTQHALQTVEQYLIAFKLVPVFCMWFCRLLDLFLLLEMTSYTTLMFCSCYLTMFEVVTQAIFYFYSFQYSSENLFKFLCVQFNTFILITLNLISCKVIYLIKSFKKCYRFSDKHKYDLNRT